jgi:hypothetical protein
MPPRSLPPHAWIARLLRGCPPGLLSVAETLQAYPLKAIPILEREIEHRREFILLGEQARNFVWWRLADAFQGFVVMSILVMSALWTFRGIARVREWMHGLDPTKLPGGAAVLSEWRTLIIDSPLATWRWEFIAVIAIVLVVGLLARNLGVILFSFQQLKPLRHAARSRETEIAILEMWMKAAKQATEKE